MINNKDNICIHFFEPGAVQYVHSLADKLKDLDVCRDIVYAISWAETYSSFVKNNSDVHSSKILSDIGAIDFDRYTNAVLSEDEFKLLNKLDSQIFDGNIWNFIYEDRHLLYRKFGPAVWSKGRYIGRNKLLRMYINRTQSICDFLSVNNVGTVVYATQDYGTGLGALIGHVSSKLNVKVIIPNITKVATKVNVIDDIYGSSSSLSREITKLLEVDDNDNNSFLLAREFISSTRNGDLSNYYKCSAYRKPLIRERVVNSIKKIVFQLKLRNSTYRDYHFQRLFGLLLLKIRTFSINNSIKLDKNFDLINEQYVYYPLHIEPEINILILGRGITDQLDIIRRVAKNLPTNIQLVVKEHPLYSGIFPLSFYRELASIPNVILVPSDTNQTDLIKNSTLVTCISGTAALEATILGIRTALFGIPYFSLCKSIHIIDNLSDLKSQLRVALKSEVDEKAIEVFIQAVLNTSIDFDVLNVGRASELVDTDYLNEEVTKYTRLIQQEIG